MFKSSRPPFPPSPTSYASEISNPALLYILGPLALLSRAPLHPKSSRPPFLPFPTSYASKISIPPPPPTHPKSSRHPFPPSPTSYASEISNPALLYILGPPDLLSRPPLPPMPFKSPFPPSSTSSRPPFPPFPTSYASKISIPQLPAILPLL